jgi:hypothetical protein
VAAAPPQYVFGLATGRRYEPAVPLGAPGAEGAAYRTRCGKAVKLYFAAPDPATARNAEAHRHLAHVPGVAWCDENVSLTLGGHVAGVVMPLAEGDDLQSVLDDPAHAARSPRSRFGLCLALGRVKRDLEACRGVVPNETDLKPGNWVVRQVTRGGDWAATLVDTTAVFVTGHRDPSGRVVTRVPDYQGTPEFRAPEKVNDPALAFDASHALFSMGVTFHEVLRDCHPCLPGGMAAVGLDLDGQVGKYAFLRYANVPGLTPPADRTPVPAEIDRLFAAAFVGPARHRPDAAMWCREFEAVIAALPPDRGGPAAPPQAPQWVWARLGPWLRPLLGPLAPLGAKALSELPVLAFAAAAVLGLSAYRHRDRIWPPPAPAAPAAVQDVYPVPTAPPANPHWPEDY